MSTQHTPANALTLTLKKQRRTLLVEPIHATQAPVKAYADQIAALKGEPFDVVTIPEGSAAHRMGYRFVSIPRTELDYYLNNGAKATGGADMNFIAEQLRAVAANLPLKKRENAEPYICNHLADWGSKAAKYFLYSLGMGDGECEFSRVYMSQLSPDKWADAQNRRVAWLLFAADLADEWGVK